MKLTHVDLFSGIGGFALAARWAGIKTVQFVEIDPFCQKVLRKNFEGVPIWSDIKTFHWGNKCETTSKKTRIDEILNSHKKPNLQGELFESVNIVEQSNPCPQALPIGDGNSVQISADMLSSEGKTGQTLTAVNGCEGRTTQTIKTGQDMTATKDIDRIKYSGGEGASSQEIIIPVKSADLSPKNQDHSMHTTKSRGEITQKIDLKSGTELPSVSLATKGSIHEIFLLTAGVPCQPASCAGKRGGHNDDRWLWEETFRVIAETKPQWVILENVAGLLSLESGVVFDYLLSDLEAQGYEVQAFIIPACAVNAPHRRDRVWIVGYAASERSNRGSENSGGIKTGMYRKGIEQDIVTTHPIGTGAGSESGTPGDERRISGEGGREGIRQGNGQIGTGGTASTDSHAIPWFIASTHPRRSGFNSGHSSKSGQESRYILPCEPDRHDADTANNTTIDGLSFADTAQRERLQGHENDPIGNSGETRKERCGSIVDVSDAQGVGLQRCIAANRIKRPQSDDEQLHGCRGEWSEPWIEVATRLCRMDARVPNRVDRLKSLGNAIVPQVAYQIMKGILEVEWRG